MAGIDYMSNEVYAWCEQCKEVVPVDYCEDTEMIDGVTYVTGADYLCPCNETHHVVGIKQCPICGNDMGENDSYCESCYDLVRFALNDLKDNLDCTQNDFEEIIGNYFGW